MYKSLPLYFLILNPDKLNQKTETQKEKSKINQNQSKMIDFLSRATYSTYKNITILQQNKECRESAKKVDQIINNNKAAKAYVSFKNC